MRSMPGHQRRSKRFATLITSSLLCVLPVLSWAKDPESLYRMECQGCHLADGNGGLESIPTLTNHVGNFLDVPGGREYLIQVPGVALSPLSDQELTNVLNWMLKTFGPPERVKGNAPFTIDEVARWRKHPLADVAKKRAELVLLMQQSASSPPPPTR